MSKVFSFRLDADNPREAQAREVIDAWVAEGYSLRYMVVELLLTYKKAGGGHEKLNSVVEQLQELVFSLDNRGQISTSEAGLSSSFLNAVKQSAKDGVKL